MDKYLVIIAATILNLSLANQLIAMEQDSQFMEVKSTNQNAITLVAGEVRHFKISQQEAELSITIKNCLECSTKNPDEIPLDQINAQVLQSIVSIFNAVNRKVQKQKRGELAQTNLIYRPNDNNPESANGGFIAQNIQPLVDKILNYQDLRQIKEVINAAHFLEIPFLINASTKVYIEKIMQQNPRIKQFTFACTLLSIDLPSPILAYFNKHFKLAQMKVKKELSFADYIALGGTTKKTTPNDYDRWFIESCIKPTQPPERRELTSQYKIDLTHKDITSLYGLSTIDEDETKDVIILDLDNNYILEKINDPDYPIRPFGRFSDMRWLRLAHNQLTIVEADTFKGLSDLTHLRLKNNKIKIIKENEFQHLEKLVNLNLANNKIEIIGPGMFDGLYQLDSLFLLNNRIKKILPTAFSRLVSLKQICLQNNQIQTILKNSFNGLRKLTFLPLENNPIKTIQPGAFSELDNLKELVLSGAELTKSSKKIKKRHFPNQNIKILIL